MNTCNYQTPYPIASHEEGGVLYSNGVQVVTISNPYMKTDDIVSIPFFLFVIVPVVGIAFLIGLFNFVFNRK